LFCAIELENWGSNLADAFSLTARDYREIQGADIVLAFPGASYGTHMELGWASAFAIPTMIFLDSTGPMTPVVTEMENIVTCKILQFDGDVFPTGEVWENLLREVKKFVDMFGIPVAVPK
jgi:nucleoside 2-deoxyribosyltransferase